MNLHEMEKVNNQIFLGLGTNLGNKLQNLAEALRRIKTEVGPIVKASSVYETAAWGMEDQPPFFNQVILVDSTHSPTATLELLLKIELDMGRQRVKKWGRRLIDIDLLFYNDWIIQTSKLILPHPFLQDRNFVLTPMVEIAPDYWHPVLKLPMHSLLAQSTDPLPVKRLNEVN